MENYSQHLFLKLAKTPIHFFIDEYIQAYFCGETSKTNENQSTFPFEADR